MPRHVFNFFKPLVLNYILSSANPIIMGQYGFQSGHFMYTVCNLIFLIIYSIHSMIKLKLMEFEEAFDRVNHDHLITLLSDLGIGDPFLTWFRSFITDKISWVIFIVQVL